MCVKILLNSWSGFIWQHFNLKTMDQGTSKCDRVVLLISQTTNNFWKRNLSHSQTVAFVKTLQNTPKHLYMNNKTCQISGLCMVRSYVVCMHTDAELFVSVIYIWMCYSLDSECCWIPFFVRQVQIANISQFKTSFVVFGRIVWADWSL